MKRHDILQELIKGQITDDQAEGICSEILSDMGRTVPMHEALGMSRCEWTAYGQGVAFEEIANWRAHGWPTQCFVCGRQINVENFGWLARENDGRTLLKHVACPKN